MTAKSTKLQATQLNYAELSAELDAVMARLEQGELDVDEAVQAYARGLEIIKTLEAHLTHAENRVNELKADSGELYRSEEE